MSSMIRDFTPASVVLGVLFNRAHVQSVLSPTTSSVNGIALPYTTVLVQQLRFPVIFQKDKTDMAMKSVFSVSDTAIRKIMPTGDRFRPSSMYVFMDVDLQAHITVPYNIQQNLFALYFERIEIKLYTGQTIATMEIPSRSQLMISNDINDESSGLQRFWTPLPLMFTVTDYQVFRAAIDEQAALEKGGEQRRILKIAGWTTASIETVVGAVNISSIYFEDTIKPRDDIQAPQELERH